MGSDGDQNFGDAANRGSTVPPSSEEGTEGVIEGGSVSGFQDYPWEPEKRHRAETARYLAFFLVAILAITIIIQYGMTFFLVYQNKESGIAVLDKLFSTLLPILSGLVSAAATYYFTREKDS